MVTEETRPAYKGLMNNIPTSLLGLKGSPWKEGTADYVKHEIILEYIRNYAKENNIDEFVRYNTRVEHVSKKGAKWEVKTSTMVKLGVDSGRLVYSVEVTISERGNFRLLTPTSTSMPL